MRIDLTENDLEGGSLMFQTSRSFLGLLRVPALLFWLSTPALAQMTPLAKLDCSSANYPSCGGWGAVQPNPYFTRALRTGAGPQGQNAVEFSHVASGSHAQYYFGWFGPSLPTPSQGVTRFIRLRFKTLGPMIPNGTGDVWGAKFIILSDGGDSSSRVICDLVPVAANGDPAGDPLAIVCHRNIEGEPNSTARVRLSNNRWHSIQIEARSSSTASNPDGQLKIWVDSANYGSPTSQSGRMQLNASNWGNINLGFYAGTTLAAGGRVVFQVADFEFDDQFDQAFVENASGGGASSAPPAAPSNLRLLSSASLLPLSALAVGVLRRRRT